MKTRMLAIFIFFPLFILFSKNIHVLKQQDLVAITNKNQDKILCGRLIEEVSLNHQRSKNSLQKAGNIKNNMILYFPEYPGFSEFQKLENLGITCYQDTWTPPIVNHPLGYMIAHVPVSSFNELLSLDFIKKVDTANRGNKAQNNDATMSVRANMVWDWGYTGSGVKIGVLDSGIDLGYAGSDLPASMEYKDYSDYPNLDDDVANTVTGHGTHVAASALGRGLLSEGHTHWNNGKGPFKGSAPAADLCFLKIGVDSTAWATDEAMIAAIDAAVNIYNVDLMSVSYGGWDSYHDGSSALEQKVDWAYEQGVPYFGSAGNASDDDKHWSGTVAANSESGFIKVEVSNAGTDDTMLRFNLLWFDGTLRNDLSLKYFNSSKELISDVTYLATTESIRGSESQYSYYNNYVPASNSVYYLKAVNNSSNEQLCHIYEDWSNLEEGTYCVLFTEADANYTIGSPASADHCFAVGAYVSKVGWTDPTDASWWYGPSYVINDIAVFSSRGPRNDGVIKPDICAPGHVLVSLRDTDVYTTQNKGWIDNDGILGKGDTDYYRMRGTSMACPIAAGAAALYMQANPGAGPQDVYDAMRAYANPSGLSGLPDNTWGSGRLDVHNALRGFDDPILVDGNIIDEKYQTLASFTNGRNGLGDDNNLGAFKYYCDGKDIFIGITGEVTANDNICLFFDFSEYSGRGTNTLGGGDSQQWVYNAFAYMGNVRLDLDADFGLAFNEGNSTQYEFFTDAIRYSDNNTSRFVGKVNQYGMNGTFDLADVFGGTGKMTVAYDSSYATDSNRGIEIRVPISAFAGVDTSQTLRMFVVLSSMYGNISNECIPGDPGADNLGNGADFSTIAGQDFFTEPVKISGSEAVSISDNLTANIPSKFVLHQNYPNPFNPQTVIGYQIGKTHQASVDVKLSVYNMLGQKVATLVNKEQTAGNYKVTFDGAGLASGVYVYKLQTGNFYKVKKMLLLD